MIHRKWVLATQKREESVVCWAKSPYGVWEQAAWAESASEAYRAGCRWVDRVIARHYPETPLGRYPPPTTEPTRRPGEPAWGVFRPGRRARRRSGSVVDDELDVAG